MTEYTYKQIIAQAKKCQENVKKEYKIGMNSKWSYYFAKVIMNTKTNVKRISFEETSNPKGNSINTTIQKADYFDMCKRLIKYVESNKKMPNYVSYKQSKVLPRLVTEIFSRILLYFNKNGAFPKYAKADSSVLEKPVFKKYGHSTDHCCDDMGQNNGYYCGCHSLQEVFRNLTGIVVSQSTIAEVCGTTTEGTDHDGLNTCVAWFHRKYGYNLKAEWKNFSDLGWNGIKKIVDSNNQDCIVHNLYRNQWGHYEVINKVYDDYCDVQNSLGDYCTNGCYYGYVEERYLSTFRSYISGISQKSIMVITRS